MDEFRAPEARVDKAVSGEDVCQSVCKKRHSQHSPIQKCLVMCTSIQKRRKKGETRPEYPHALNFMTKEDYDKVLRESPVPERWEPPMDEFCVEFCEFSFWKPWTGKGDVRQRCGICKTIRYKLKKGVKPMPYSGVSEHITKEEYERMLRGMTKMEYIRMLRRK